VIEKFSPGGGGDEQAHQIEQIAHRNLHTLRGAAEREQELNIPRQFPPVLVIPGRQLAENITKKISKFSKHCREWGKSGEIRL
jgi:hypothetical protein